MGDPCLLLAESFLALEKQREAVGEGFLPQREQGRAELVRAAQFGGSTFAGEEFKDDLGLELGGEGPPLPSWHDQRPPQGPVFHIILVSPEGRTTQDIHKRLRHREPCRRTGNRITGLRKPIGPAQS